MARGGMKEQDKRREGKEGGRKKEDLACVTSRTRTGSFSSVQNVPLFTPTSQRNDSVKRTRTGGSRCEDNVHQLMAYLHHRPFDSAALSPSPFRLSAMSFHVDLRPMPPPPIQSRGTKKARGKRRNANGDGEKECATSFVLTPPMAPAWPRETAPFQRIGKPIVPHLSIHSRRLSERRTMPSTISDRESSTKRRRRSGFARHRGTSLRCRTWPRFPATPGLCVGTASRPNRPPLWGSL